MNCEVRGIFAQIPIAGVDIEKLIVYCRDYRIVQLVAQVGEFDSEIFLLGHQPEQFVSLGAYVIYVGDYGLGMSAYLLQMLVVGVGLLQDLELHLKRLNRVGDAVVHRLQVFAGSGRSEAGRGGDEHAAVLGDLEGGGHFGDAVVVHVALRVSNPVE